MVTAKANSGSKGVLTLREIIEEAKAIEKAGIASGYASDAEDGIDLASLEHADLLRDTAEAERQIAWLSRKPGTEVLRPKKSWRRTVVLLLMIALTLLFFVELNLRLLPEEVLDGFKSGSQPAREKVNFYLENNFAARYVRGIPLAPNFADEISTDDFDFWVQTNSVGIREKDEIREPGPGTFRVLGLGDSLAFGWGVQSDETFLKIFEWQLNQKPPAAGLKYEVINAGVPGTGTGAALKFLKNFGLGFRPGLVMLAFNEADDFEENAETFLKEKSKPSGSAAGSSPRLPILTDAGRFLVRKSLLARILDSNFSGRVSPRTGEQASRHYLLEMKALLDPHGIPLAVVYIPDAGQAGGTAHLGRFSMISSGGPARVRQDFENFCRRNGIMFLRLTAPFEGRAAAKGVRFKDGHLNRIGHRAAAGKITEFFRREAGWQEHPAAES